MVPLHRATHLSNHLFTGLRIPWPIGNQHRVEFFSQKIVVPRDTDNGHSSGKQASEDAVFAAAIYYHNPVFPPRIDHGTIQTNLGYQVISIGVIQLHIILVHEDLAQHTALLSQPLGERPGIYSPQRRHPLFNKPLRKASRGIPVVVVRRHLGNHQTRDLQLIGFERTTDLIHRMIARYPIVTYEGIGSNQNLPFIGRISQGLRIPNHAGVEHDFSGDRLWKAKTAALKHRSIFQR